MAERDDLREHGYRVPEGELSLLEAEALEWPPLHPEREAPEPSAAGAPRSVLEPMAPPPPSPYGRDRRQAVTEFVERIADLDEADYGDWMRKANTYWWDLAEALGGTSSSKVVEMMRKMHTVIQYRPDFRVDQTRLRVADCALDLLDALGGNGQIDLHRFHLATQSLDRVQQVPPYSGRSEQRRAPRVESVVSGNQGFVGK